MEPNKIINGTFGKLWIDTDLFANVKSFEAKVSLNYEDVDIAGDLAKHRKYVGYEGEGTAVLHKIDSRIAKKLSNGIKTGDMPTSKLVGALSDPAAYGSERVEILGVTFDEVTLIKFENKTLGEEEVPFKFSGFNYLDFI